MTKIHHSTALTDAEGIFYATVDIAEGARQVAVATAANAAAVRPANITYHRAVVTAAITAGAPHLGVASRNALIDLTGTPA